MKKISILMVMFLVLSGITFAQERGGGERPSRTQQSGRPGGMGDRQQMTPEQRIERQTQQLVEQLKLTKDQEAKVTAINKKYQDKQSSVDWSKMRDASDAERTKIRAEMTRVQAEKDKEIKAILKADQIKLYDEMLKKREENRRNGQGRMGGQGGQGQ
jgi:Spy/CpxP family protein refolding chaperone